MRRESLSHTTEGRYWPTLQDRQPQLIPYRFPTGSLFEEPTPGEPLKRLCLVLESNDSVDERLRGVFPLYRIASALGFVSVASNESEMV